MTTTEQATETALCSKCGERPHAPKHRWCNRCKASHQQEYNAIATAQSDAQAFARGCEATQRYIVGQLRNLPPAGLLMTSEVAGWIERMERPGYAPNVTEQASLPDAP